MIVGRTWSIFFVTVTIQITILVISGAKGSNCPTYGNSCYRDDPEACCGRYLECKQSKDSRYQCKCKSDYLWNDGLCQYVPEKICLTNTDCEENKFSECSAYGLCNCKSNYIKTSPHTCRGLIEANCTKNQDCNPLNSICIDGLCKCKCDYLSTAADLCLPTFFELTCSANDERCQDEELSGCVHGKCYCHPNHVVVNMTCQPLLNESCKKYGLCAIQNSICNDNKECQCKSGYKALSNKRCLPTRMNNDCKVDSDCRFLSNSKCLKFNYCSCNDYHFQVNQTTCGILIGGKCESNADCMIENSFCINGFCKCKSSYADHFNMKCITALHKHCEEDSDCVQGTFTKCSENKICECEPNYIASKEHKVCLPSIDGICDSDDDCVIENSYCHLKNCQCKKSYYPSMVDGTHKCVQMLLGHPCRSNYDCRFADNFVCSSDKICICSGKHYALTNRTLCLPTIGGACSRNEDCQLKNSLCLNGTCRCDLDSSAVSPNECVQKSLAVSCNKDIECGEPWHAGCSSDHNCFCRANNTLINKSTCLPMIGGICLGDHQCTVENSICDGFQCRCKPPNFIRIANNLCIPIHILIALTP